MDEDRKLKLLETMFDLALKPGFEYVYMWFAIPGGIIQGKPITPEEYRANFLGQNPSSEASPSPEISESEEKEEKQKRFYTLTDVTLRQGNTNNLFHVAVVDGLEVGAWGFYDPSKSFMTTE